MARHAGQGQAVCKHRGDDDQKHDGQQAFGIGVAGVYQGRAKNAGRSRCHDAARRNPGQQLLVGLAHGRAESGQPNGQRAHHQQDGQHEQGSAPVQLADLAEFELRRDHDKQYRQKHHGEVFLEVPQIFPFHQFHVANDQAHQGHAEQARLMLNPVAGPVADQHQHHEQGRLEVRRNGAAPEKPAGSPAANPSEDGCRRNRRAHALRHLGPAAVGEGEILKSQNRQQHAHGVVHDAFPFEQCSRILVESGLPQQGQDHGGARHHQNGAQHPGHRPAQPGNVVRCQPPEQPGQRRAQHRESPDAVADPAKLAGFQVHAPFE